MPSTYSSNLKIELMSTGENSGTWGGITNTNLGTALEQAVVGYGNPNYSSDANLTISLTNSNAAQTARALVLNVTSGVSLTTTRELVVPTIQKQYIVQNNTTGGQSITVKTSAGTGITVPNGRKAHLYVDGTNVIQMFDFVDINGGTIDGATVGAASASTGAFTTLTASGATTLNGTVALGNATADLITIPGTVNSNVLFTDNTYDIGASGATRPRNLFLAGNATVGGNLSVVGTLTMTGAATMNGNVTLGNAAADLISIPGTINSNVLFTDNTYDIGASGATRPRNLYLSNNLVVGGAQTLTGALTVDSTTDSSSTTTGSIQTDGGVGIAKALFVGTTATINTLNLTNALGGAYGGTGLASYTTGDLLYASGATTLSKLADVATGSALISGGVGIAPSWGKIGLTTHVSGTLPTGSGGTGLTTFTAANRAIYSTSASALTAGTLPSAAGGTGLTTFTAANRALYSTSASALTAGTLPVAAGGTGTTTPSLVAGTNITICGTWPNQTINASGGGGGSPATPTAAGIVYGRTDADPCTLNYRTALGYEAGNTGQGNNSVAIGYQSGFSTQCFESVAIGYQSGYALQQPYALAIGWQAGYCSQSSEGVAIGVRAGQYTQGYVGIAIGECSGTNTQGSGAVAIGFGAGTNCQGGDAVALGISAGQTAQGVSAVAIGANAGNSCQGAYSIAIGYYSGEVQGGTSVAIGHFAGNNGQGCNAVAIGTCTGRSQGANSVALGARAGYSCCAQPANTIIINATGANFQATGTCRTHVAPIRNAVTCNPLYYNPATGEITYG